MIPVSYGELFDKISILEIKKVKIKSKEQLDNVERELFLLKDIVNLIAGDIPDSLVYDLKVVNSSLWVTEDYLRDMEREKIFDTHFIKSARDVYKLNDKRSKIKNQINKLLSSDIVEEKSYSKY